MSEKTEVASQWLAFRHEQGMSKDELLSPLFTEGKQSRNGYVKIAVGRLDECLVQREKVDDPVDGASRRKMTNLLKRM